MPIGTCVIGCDGDCAEPGAEVSQSSSGSVLFRCQGPLGFALISLACSGQVRMHGAKSMMCSHVPHYSHGLST